MWDWTKIGNATTSEQVTARQPVEQVIHKDKTPNKLIRTAERLNEKVTQSRGIDQDARLIRTVLHIHSIPIPSKYPSPKPTCPMVYQQETKIQNHDIKAGGIVDQWPTNPERLASRKKKASDDRGQAGRKEIDANTNREIMLIKAVRKQV